jgi:hypothetical protein
MKTGRSLGRPPFYNTDKEPSELVIHNHILLPDEDGRVTINTTKDEEVLDPDIVSGEVEEVDDEADPGRCPRCGGRMERVEDDDDESTRPDMGDPALVESSLKSSALDRQRKNFVLARDREQESVGLARIKT